VVVEALAYMVKAQAGLEAQEAHMAPHRKMEALEEEAVQMEVLEVMEQQMVVLEELMVVVAEWAKIKLAHIIHLLQMGQVQRVLPVR